MFQGLSPHIMSITPIFFHLFLHVTFSCRLRIFISRSIAWVWFSTGFSYTGTSGRVTPVGGLLRWISICMPFLTGKDNFIVASLCPTKGVAWRLLSPRKRLYAGEFFKNPLLTASCCTVEQCPLSIKSRLITAYSNEAIAVRLPNIPDR